jgi:hypothetical protein
VVLCLHSTALLSYCSPCLKQCLQWTLISPGKLFIGWRSSTTHSCLNSTRQRTKRPSVQRKPRNRVPIINRPLCGFLCRSTQRWRDKRTGHAARHRSVVCAHAVARLRTASRCPCPAGLEPATRSSVSNRSICFSNKRLHLTSLSRRS